MGNTVAPACGKVHHFNARSAWRHVGLLVLAGLHGNKPGDLLAYRCPRCGHWHVGHQQRQGVSLG